MVLTGLKEMPDVPVDTLKKTRVGMYKPWIASMDEGWTRWILEQYHFNQRSIDNKSMRTSNLKEGFDAIILPSMSKETIIEGRGRREENDMRYFKELPPEYTGGIGRDGVTNLKKFVTEGGTLIALSQACDFVSQEFELPVTNTLARTTRSVFNSPGSIIHLNVDTTHPVTYGLPEQVYAFVTDSIAFQTIPPGPEMTRRVLVSFPDAAEDIPASGWILGAEQLERKSAVVVFGYGKGKIVLLGFRVQHRAQTDGTYKFLFNAIHWAGM
jgi:hypothetical protein